MKIDYRYWQHSLKFRITLSTLAIFLLSIWTLSFYASHMLQQDMQHLLGEQQFSTVSVVAEDVNEELNDRLRALELVAQNMMPSTPGNARALQAMLEQRPLLKQMFNGGYFVTGIDGVALASYPLSLDRAGTNYMDRDYIVGVLKNGKSTIGQPVIGRKLLVPVLVMAVPIRNNLGKVIGALAGVVDLGSPNFLDKITHNHYGKSGGYALVIPEHRLIVTATDKSRVMQFLPATGVNPMLDRFLQGYEGSAVYTNPFGVEVLASAKQIPVANWLLGVTLPAAEAFAPIEELQQRVLLATLLLTLLTGSLTWWILRRQLSPMSDAVNTMTALSDTSHPPQQLPVGREDEIGKLIGGFNVLFKTLAQREEALIDSNEFSRSIIDASPVPLAINDQYGNITFVNLAFTQSLGYTLSDIPTLAKWWLLAYPDQQYQQSVADRWQERMAETKRSHKAFSPMEINIQCKDKSVRTYMATASAIEGGFSKTHLVILYDITERKQTEVALMTATERLNEAQHSARIGNWILDLSSGELLWSDEIFRIFEIDQQQFGATYAAFLNAIHPDDRDAVNLAYTNSLECRIPYEITHRLRMADGRIKWVKEKCMSTFDSAGKPLQSRGMVQDITDIKQTELALIAARDLANHANHAKSEFLSSMSHELRTPLNAILGFSQLLKLSSNLSRQELQNVDEVLNAGKHLLELINQILDLARIESGHLKLLMETVEICSVVEECMNLLTTMAEKRGIRFSHAGMQGVKIKTDRIRLKQVLLNLCSNAIKYNREGGNVHIEVRQQGADRLRILVTDSGQGIPAARLQELFQPFNRLGAEKSNVEGSGIGLSITRSLVEAMGGCVDVESEVGVGSTFWIELPLEIV